MIGGIACVLGCLCLQALGALVSCAAVVQLLWCYACCGGDKVVLRDNGGCLLAMFTLPAHAYVWTFFRYICSCHLNLGTGLHVMQQPCAACIFVLLERYAAWLCGFKHNILCMVQLPAACNFEHGARRSCAACRCFSTSPCLNARHSPRSSGCQLCFLNTRYWNRHLCI